MKTINKLYILPGWGHRITDKEYQAIIKSVRGYENVPLRLRTRNRKWCFGSDNSLEEIINDIDKQIIKPHNNDVLLGFSIGSLQALILAQRHKFRKVILCSCSAILSDDLKKYTSTDLTNFTKSQIRDLSKLKYSHLKSPRIILYGDMESPPFIPGKKIFVKNTGHRLTKEYQKEILKQLRLARTK